MSYKHRKNLEKYKESERIRQKTHRERLREYILEIKKIGCSICGESHPSCLQFHHINPETKTDRISRLLAQTKSIEKVKKEIEKCILICANCHAKKHWNETH